jgi:hypothetical protein
MHAFFGFLILSGIFGVIFDSALAGFGVMATAVAASFVAGLFTSHWAAELEKQGEAEEPIRELWQRLSDKPQWAVVLHPAAAGRWAGLLILGPLALLVVASLIAGVSVFQVTAKLGPVSFLAIEAGLGWVLWRLFFMIARKFGPYVRGEYEVMGSYGDVRRYVESADTAEEVLRRAPSLWHAAKGGLWGPRRFFVTVGALGSNRPEYFDSGRLEALLRILEAKFPVDAEDETLRVRYWNYGRAIYQLLMLRGVEGAKGSLFAKGLPKNPESERQERKARLAAERERLADTKRKAWSGGEMSLEEALDVIGVAEVPSESALRRFQDGLLEGASGAEREELVMAFAVIRESKAMA